MEPVTPEDIRSFADRRAARDLEARRALHRRAAHDAGAIVEMIVCEFNPERVVQWGLALHPEHFQRYLAACCRRGRHVEAAKGDSRWSPRRVRRFRHSARNSS
ncbi:MAG: hypothetical protein ACLFUX_06855 [Spirochaetaceae bacterium]